MSTSLEYCPHVDCYQYRPCKAHVVERVLVTGGNKGIGFAIVEALLKDHHFDVLLAARDRERGIEAISKIVKLLPGAASRVSFIQLDVTSEQSVQEAYDHLVRSFPEEKTPLTGLISNAGAGEAEAFQVNFFGVQRVCEKLIPLLRQDTGRIVVVSSVAGVIFVAKCPEVIRKQFVNTDVTLEELEALAKDCQSTTSAEAELKYGSPLSAYAMSKALVNLYVMNLSKRFPHLKVNACMPGLIETDIARSYVTGVPKAQADWFINNWKPPAEGTKSSVYLMTAPNLEGNGRYYSEDCKSSPFDRHPA